MIRAIDTIMRILCMVAFIAWFALLCSRHDAVMQWQWYHMVMIVTAAVLIPVVVMVLVYLLYWLVRYGVPRYVKYWWTH